MSSIVETEWKPEDSERALRIWDEYQRSHDVSARRGEAVAIDPRTGEVWFGDDMLDITRQREARGRSGPTFALRVGRDYYYRKGRRE
jgi:hypothetical protein